MDEERSPALGEREDLTPPEPVCSAGHEYSLAGEVSCHAIFHVQQPEIRILVWL